MTRDAQDSLDPAPVEPRRDEPGLRDEAGAPAQPYPGGAAHLRDELWRAWLCVAYHIHRRWELGTLPRTPEAESSLFRAANVLGLLVAAGREHLGQAGPPGDGATDSAARVLEAFRAQSARIDARLAAGEAAGTSLPIVEVARRFELDHWQRATLVLALMPELDPDLLIAYRYLANDPNCRGLDGRLLATMVYETPELRPRLALDLSPASPLVRYRLLEIDDSLGLHDPNLYRRIQVAPRLVQIAVDGARDLDPQLRELASLAAPAREGLFPEDLVRRADEALGGDDVLVVVQGPRGTGKRLLLANAARRRGKRLLLVRVDRLTLLGPAELLAALRSLTREARLLDALLVIPDIDEALTHAEPGESLPRFIGRLCAEHQGPIALTFTAEHLPRITERPVIHLAVRSPNFQERIRLWREYVPALVESDVTTLAERFNVPGGVIEIAARATQVRPEAAASMEAFDRSVRAQLHDRLARLGRRIDASATFDDLVMEQHTLETLLEIGATISHRRRVREDWGFRGAPGVSVLFSGAPGVGKTMSATVLGHELGMAVYEIDLSTVVSKWIGETEKNLEEIFRAGDAGHAILLFNEADSLFGKRTVDVRNATDRYSNLETNYLLQRLEQFSGVAILTSNLTGAIDSAFRRRFVYDVQFPFPTVEMRAELWRRAVPRKAEVSTIDYDYLAEEFELSGGFIKMAVERSAYVAYATKVPLSTEVIVPVIQRMYLERGKLEATGRLE